jgi:hypothetical protein
VPKRVRPRGCGPRDVKNSSVLVAVFGLQIARRDGALVRQRGRLRSLCRPDTDAARGAGTWRISVPLMREGLLRALTRISKTRLCTLEFHTGGRGAGSGHAGRMARRNANAGSASRLERRAWIQKRSLVSDHRRWAEDPDESRRAQRIDVTTSFRSASLQASSSGLHKRQSTNLIKDKNETYAFGEGISDGMRGDGLPSVRSPSKGGPPTSV